MKTYLVEYFTKDGRRIGMQVSAYTSIDARQYAEKLPDFRNMANYPQEVGR